MTFGKRVILCLSTLVPVLSACATVQNETTSLLVVDGVPYELRTRTIETRDGSYQTTSAIVGNLSWLCRPDSPGDCAAAVRRGRDSIEDR